MSSSKVAATSNEVPAATYSLLQRQRKCCGSTRGRLTPVYSLTTPGTRCSSSYTTGGPEQTAPVQSECVSAFKLD